MKVKRMLLLFAVIATLVVGYLVAQARDKDDAGKTVTATGCLSKGDEAGEFYLSADSGRRYELRSDKVSLSDHVGHKVTVTGTPQKESEAEEREEGKHNEAAENEAPNLQVTDLHMVSTSCK